MFWDDKKERANREKRVRTLHLARPYNNEARHFTPSRAWGVQVYSFTNKKIEGAAAAVLLRDNTMARKNIYFLFFLLPSTQSLFRAKADSVLNSRIFALWMSGWIR